MPDPQTVFQNPLTGTNYRIWTSADGGTWRITKTVRTADATVVRHLRGETAAAIAPAADAIDRLVRGEHQAGSPIHADPQAAFAESVLLDLDRTVSVLTALAHDAQRRRTDGVPGFRPGCATLRQEEQRSLQHAIAGCRQLAASWVAGGFVVALGLPDWLQAAVDDLATAKPAEPSPP